MLAAAYVAMATRTVSNMLKLPQQSLTLRRRHCSTDTFLTILLGTPLQDPHSQLNDYLAHSTAYQATDGDDFVKSERRYRMDLSRYDASNYDVVENGISALASFSRNATTDLTCREDSDHIPRSRPSLLSHGRAPSAFRRRSHSRSNRRLRSIH